MSDDFDTGDTVQRPAFHAQSKTPSPESFPTTMLKPIGAFRLGDVVDGRYRVLERLAAGGMGEVFKVEHVDLGKKFALKVMLGALVADAQSLSRFKAEAVAVGRIGHPNIIDVTDFGQSRDGRFFFVMEFLDGRTLASALESDGPMSIDRLAHVGAQVAGALSAAHELGIVHRDLKPENVMLLQRRGQPDFVKVLDFGVAKVRHGTGQTRQTAAGHVVGTPRYMSPEQARASTVDHRSDIYSLGLILYEFVSGRPPFTGETPAMLMVKHVTELPPPIDGIPEALRALIFRMLEKQPSDRPQSMKEVASALCEVSAGRPTQTPTPAPLRLTPASAPSIAPSAVPGADEVVLPTRSRTPLLLLAALGALVLGGVGWLAVSSEVSRPAVVGVTPTVAVPPPALAALERREVAVVLETLPERAEVFEGAVLLGTTPLTLTRPEGTTLALSVVLPGFRRLERQLSLARATTVVLSLEKLATAAPPPKKSVAKKGRAVASDLHDIHFLQTEDLKPLPEETP